MWPTTLAVVCRRSDNRNRRWPATTEKIKRQYQTARARPPKIFHSALGTFQQLAMTTRTTPVQEAAAITLQTKHRSNVAKKRASNRWKESQLLRLNLWALLVQKDFGTHQRNVINSQPPWRVSVAAAKTIQAWNRSLKQQNQEKHETRGRTPPVNLAALREEQQKPAGVILQSLDFHKHAKILCFVLTLSVLWCYCTEVHPNVVTLETNEQTMTLPLTNLTGHTETETVMNVTQEQPMSVVESLINMNEDEPVVVRNVSKAHFELNATLFQDNSTCQNETIKTRRDKRIVRVSKAIVPAQQRRVNHTNTTIENDSFEEKNATTKPSTHDCLSLPQQQKPSQEFLDIVLPLLTNEFAKQTPKSRGVFLDCASNLNGEYAGLMGCMY